VAKVQGGILESWESHTVLTPNRRTRMTPVYQRPGTGAELTEAPVSETSEGVRELASEGNRSEREDGGGSLSCLIVAPESRVTTPEGACE
jgi:hypothetical protein